MALHPNSPIKRLRYVAKQYGVRSPGVVLDTFMLLSDLAGIERPHVMSPQTWTWNVIAFQAPFDRAVAMSLVNRRMLLWGIPPDAPIDEATYPREGQRWPAHDPWATVRITGGRAAMMLDLEKTSQADLMDGLLDYIDRNRTDGMFRRFDSDPIWPWVARELNRAKKRSVRAGRAHEYVDLLNALRGKGPALAQWQEQEGVDLNRTSAAEALEALETFEFERDVEEGEVVYRWDDGWTVQELRTDAQLAQEGEVMQHCVGDYCEQVESGAVTIYSLRDPGGKPHATMEVPRGTSRFAQVKGKQNAPPIEEYQARVDEFGEAEGILPATMTENEKAAASRLGSELAEQWWDWSAMDIVDRSIVEAMDLEQSLIDDVVFQGIPQGMDADVYEEAEAIIMEAAEGQWEMFYKDAMQQLDDMVDEVAEEIRVEYIEKGDEPDDDEAVNIAEGWIWDIPGAGSGDAEYIAGHALARARNG